MSLLDLQGMAKPARGFGDHSASNLSVGCSEDSGLSLLCG